MHARHISYTNFPPKPQKYSLFHHLTPSVPFGRPPPSFANQSNHPQFCKSTLVWEIKCNPVYPLCSFNSTQFLTTSQVNLTYLPIAGKLIVIAVSHLFLSGHKGYLPCVAKSTSLPNRPFYILPS